MLKTIFSFMAFIKRWWTFISPADFIYGYVIFDDLWELKPESSFPELRFAFVFVSIFYDTNFLASPVIRVFTMFSLFLDYSTIFVSSKACRHSSGEGVSKCKLISWQLSNYKYFFLKAKKKSISLLKIEYRNGLFLMNYFKL